MQISENHENQHKENRFTWLEGRQKCQGGEGKWQLLNDAPLSTYLYFTKTGYPGYPKHHEKRI